MKKIIGVFLLLAFLSIATEKGSNGYLGSDKGATQGYPGATSICTLTVVAGAHGTVTAASIIDTCGDALHDTAIAEGGYLFLNWTSRQSHTTFTDANDSLGEFILSANDTVDANFASFDSGSFALTDITNNRVYQRLTVAGEPGGTACTVTVSGRCKKYTGSIKALVLHVAGDTVVNWTTIATSPDSGNFAKKLNVPAGCWYNIKVCDDLKDTVAGTNRWGVGDIWLAFGQSRIMGWSSPHVAARDTSSDSAINFSKLAWERLIDPHMISSGASPFIILMRDLVNKTKTPQAIVNCAVGATSIYTHWYNRVEPLSDTSTSIYNVAVAHANLAGGKIYGLIAGAGESDISGGVSTADYMVRFDSVVTRFRNDLGCPNIPAHYFQVGLRTISTEAAAEKIHTAQINLENHTKKYYMSTTTWDLPMIEDSCHFTMAAEDTLGVRFSKSIIKWVDNTIDTYPRITGISALNDSVVRISTTAKALIDPDSLPNLIILDSNGDTLSNRSYSVNGSYLYDTLSEKITADTVRLYYGAERYPAVSMVLKDTGGFPLPQVHTRLDGGLQTRYTVTYDGNTNTGGTVPVDVNSPHDSNGVVTVLGNSGSLVKTGYTWANWNTAANGSGTSYNPSDVFIISANTTLYAQWQIKTYANKARRYFWMTNFILH